MSILVMSAFIELLLAEKMNMDGRRSGYFSGKLVKWNRHYKQYGINVF